MEELLVKAFILSIWTLICILSGVYDGFMYFLADSNKLEKLNGKHPHPHDIATGLRILTASGLCYLSGIFTIYNLPVAILALGLVFSFWHNGMYYCTRSTVGWPFNVPTYNFFSHSKTSTGFKVKLFGRTIQPFEMGPIYRTVLMILGITLLYFI